MSCKWSPKSDDYKYDACEEYDFLYNDEPDDNHVATMFQSDDSNPDQIENSTPLSEIGFLLRQSGIPTEYKDYKLSSDRTGINLLGNNPLTVTGFPSCPLPFDHFKLGNSEKCTPPVKETINAAENKEPLNASSTCLIVKLPEETTLQESDGAVGLSADFVNTPSEASSKKKKKKNSKETLPVATKHKPKDVTAKKKKKPRWTAVQIPERFDIFTYRPNLRDAILPG